jgi:phospholipid/cholesterol/gamma-HCH transport system substrate-binding protein
LKFSKEIKAALIALLAIVVLIAGINFLKGNSFFGGDDVYTAYFPNSGQLMVSSNVTLDGVEIGKVMSIKSNPQEKRTTRSIGVRYNDVNAICFTYNFFRTQPIARA